MNSTHLHRLRTTPGGRKLWTYMAAILEVTGMDQGKAYPLNKFLGNFKTHLDSQRIVRDPDGYRLTPVGQDYFRDRHITGSPQFVQRAEVEQMITGIKTGSGIDEWIEI